MSKDIVFKVPIEGFQFLRKDGANYNIIPSGSSHTIIENREMLITDEIDIVGDLNIDGELEVTNFHRADIDVNAAAITALEAAVKVDPSTDHAVPRFDGIEGVLQDSGVTIDDSDNVYIPSRVGVGTAVDDYSKLVIGGTMTADFGMPAGKAFLDLQGTIDITGSFKRAAAFNANITLTDNGSALQFISGMLFEMNRTGTGSWGANAGVWGQAPTIVAARWSTGAGSGLLGNHGNTFFSGTPDFAGSGGDFSAGNFSHFEAGRTENNDTRFQYSYGFYAWPQGSTDESAGLFVRAGMNSATFSAGIILADDSDGGRIVFGAGRDASIYYDGTDFVFDSRLQGTGDFKYLNGAIVPIAGAYNNCAIQSPNEAGTGLYFPSANKMYLNCGGVTGGLFFGTKSSGNFSNFGVGIASTDDKYPFAIQRNHDNTCIFNMGNTSDGSNAATYQDIQTGNVTNVAMRFGTYSSASTGITQQNAAITTYNKANNLVFIAAGTAMNNSIRFYCGGIASTDQTMELYANQTTETKGGIIRKTETITASSDTLDEGNHFVFCDTTSNAITINLPAASSNTGREYFIKCTNAANNVTVDGNGSETIDGLTTQTVVYPNTIRIICDGVSWWIV